MVGAASATFQALDFFPSRTLAVYGTVPDFLATGHALLIRERLPQLVALRDWRYPLKSWSRRMIGISPDDFHRSVTVRVLYPRHPPGVPSQNSHSWTNGSQELLSSWKYNGPKLQSRTPVSGQVHPTPVVTETKLKVNPSGPAGEVPGGTLRQAIWNSKTQAPTVVVPYHTPRLVRPSPGSVAPGGSEPRG